MGKHRAFAHLTFVFLLALGPAGAGAAAPAARVNDAEISESRLQHAFDSYLQREKIDPVGVRDPDKFKQIKRGVLETLIDHELLWQEAKRKELVAADAEVQAAVENVRKQFDNEKSYIAELRIQGRSEADFAEDMRRRLSIQRLMREDIASGIQVSDEEVATFYRQNPAEFVSPEEVHTRHILLKVAPEADAATREAARERITALLEQARGGADFAELAREHSEGPSAPRGGDLGFAGRGQFVSAFEDAAFALQPGELSGVVETGFGFHIIKLEARRGGERVPESAVSDQIRAYLLNLRMREAVQARVRALRDAAEIKILADL